MVTPFACLHYKLPKTGHRDRSPGPGAVERERAACSSAPLPTPFLDGRYSGQVAFGVAQAAG